VTLVAFVVTLVTLVASVATFVAFVATLVATLALTDLRGDLCSLCGDPRADRPSW
jgi:hypothetical protein